MWGSFLSKERWAFLEDTVALKARIASRHVVNEFSTNQESRGALDVGNTIWYGVQSTPNYRSKIFRINSFDQEGNDGISSCGDPSSTPQSPIDKNGDITVFFSRASSDRSSLRNSSSEIADTTMLETELPVRLPLQLTPEDRAEYAAVANTVLQQTLQLYQQHLQDPREPESRRRKLLKRREHIAIYSSRDKNHTTAFHEPNTFPNPTPIQQSAKWVPQCKLRCLGSLIGSLEDALYGGITPTETAMMTRSLSIQDEFAEHKTLCDIAVPTEEEPFTYVGLKWSGRTAYLATMVKPRDMTYVESTGEISILLGGKLERVGYAVYHSVDLPQLPPLKDKGIQRSRMSLAVLIRQTESRKVEVFSTISSMASGDLPSKLTTLFSAAALIAIHKVTDNAMKKKLGWMQAARMYGNVDLADMPPSWTPPHRESFFGVTISTCPQCLRELSSLRSESVCHICETRVCSRCLTSRKLVVGRKKTELKYERVPICKGCISTALKMDYSRELAIYEFVRAFQFPRESFAMSDTNETVYSSLATGRCTDELSVSSVDEIVPAYPSEHQENDHFSEERLRLWDQINVLRMKAEQTYRITTNQSREIWHQQPH